MSASYASNAVLSKARAMYGKHLTERDYENLLNCKTVSEVMSYLKAHTKYAPLLGSVNENEVHRGQLETIIRQQIFYDFESLCRYEISVGEHFSQYIIRRAEIEQIMHYLMLLSAGHPEKYIYLLPLYFTRVSRVDLNALANARSYDEFLNTLGKTSYRKMLDKFKPSADGSLNLSEIEDALYTDLYKNMYKIIDKYTKGAEKRSLKLYFDRQIDLTNFVRILRLSKYYHFKGEDIKKHLLPFGTLKPTQIDAMCQAGSSKEIFAIMQSTMAGKCISKLEYSFASQIIQRASYNVSRHNLRFSTSAAVVMFAYIDLAQTELSNIINIIEGVRYSVNADEIKDILIYN